MRCILSDHKLQKELGDTQVCTIMHSSFLHLLFVVAPTVIVVILLTIIIFLSVFLLCVNLLFNSLAPVEEARCL